MEAQESSKHKLSLAMIVKDETETLFNCLDSVKDHVDEIVVAWNGSNPKTKEILDEFNCRVVPYTWKDDFADARTFSFKHTSNELVFWCDADDVIVHAEKLRDLCRAFDDKRVGSVWLPYEYDFDEYGHCVMLLYRERIVRKSLWDWKGRVHEVLLPNKECAHVKEDDVIIRHTVLKDRVVQSADRNLRISQKGYEEEQKAGDLDARTIWDYARALKASGNREAAVEVFKEFIQKTESDDDRYEAYRAVADIYRKFRWWDSAIEAELASIKLRPQRPEAYFGLAETHFCLEDWDNVIWYTDLGYKCPPRDDNMPVDPIAIKAKPLLPLHFALIQKSRFQDALVVADKALQFFPRSEYLKQAKEDTLKLIDQEEIEKSCLHIHEYLARDGESHKLRDFAKAVPEVAADHPVFVRLINQHRTDKDWQNRIVIYCGPSYEFWDPTDIKHGIGGSEEAVINIAPRLAKMGWQVEVYNNILHEGNYDGVLWKPFDQWPTDKSRKCAIFIAWRDSRSTLLAPDGSVVCAWLHDKQKPEYWSQEMIDRVDKFFFLSEYHRTDLPELPDNKIFITSNGIVPAHFISSEARDPKRCVYASSPDRGLDVLLDCWPNIKKEVPEANLHIYYGFTKNYDQIHKNDAKMQAFRDQILKQAKQPGVTWHGRIGQLELAKEFTKSGLWLYPTHFMEISCITAMKVQAAGAIPVTMTLAALNETVQHGLKISHTIRDFATQKAWTNHAIRLLNNEEEQDRLRKPMMEWARKEFDWDNVAKKWSDLFKAEVKKPVVTP